MGSSSYVTYCRLCNAKVPAQYSFCTECGQSLSDSSIKLSCASCGENLSEEYRFCPECGEKIESIGTCPRCTARLKPGTTYCTECGLNLDEEGDSDKTGDERDSDKTSAVQGLRDERNTPPEKERYLVCTTCRGYYQLQRGEEPQDFSDECECGGRLECRDFKE
jgi:predicted amidophosphoribosyltransferase